MISLLKNNFKGHEFYQNTLLYKHLKFYRTLMLFKRNTKKTKKKSDQNSSDVP